MLINGLAIGLPDELQFRPDRSNVYCRICGAVFQSDYDRDPQQFAQSIEFSGSVELVEIYARSLRKEWSHKHSKSHTSQEHFHLALTKNHLTAEAAHKLAAFGVIAITDMVLNEEVAAAYRESSAMPTNDCES